MAKPLIEEVPAYYRPFLKTVPEDEVVLALKSGLDAFVIPLQGIDVSLHDYAYAEGKWTIKEVVQHVVDTERIFAYRALCIARGETNKLAGFDQLLYAENVDCSKKSLEQILSEFRTVRLASLSLFESFGSNELNRRGNTNGLDVNVNLLGFIMCGHALHHGKVMAERYLSN